MKELLLQLAEQLQAAPIGELEVARTKRMNLQEQVLNQIEHLAEKEQNRELGDVETLLIVVNKGTNMTALDEAIFNEVITPARFDEFKLTQAESTINPTGEEQI